MTDAPQPATLPDDVTQLQTIYGPPSQPGFGSAVFYEPQVQAEALEQVALKTYRYFVGDLWERWGEAAWMTPWKLVYQRQPDASHQVVQELAAISDANTALSASMLLESPENLQAAQAALSAVFDHATVTNLVVYAIGDGSAMSGLLLAGRRDNGDTTLLIFLLD